jgi:hypothetical protein
MIELKSLAFDAGDKIPATYTCEGENVSPPIVWTGGPKGTQSFALVIPYLPHVGVLGFVPLPPSLLLALATLTLAYVFATELLKRWFYRRFA